MVAWENMILLFLQQVKSRTETTKRPFYLKSIKNLFFAQERVQWAIQRLTNMLHYLYRQINEGDKNFHNGNFTLVITELFLFNLYTHVETFNDMARVMGAQVFISTRCHEICEALKAGSPLNDFLTEIPESCTQYWVNP